MVWRDNPAAMSWRSRSRMGMMRGGMGGAPSSRCGSWYFPQDARSPSHAQDVVTISVVNGYSYLRGIEQCPLCLRQSDEILRVLAEIRDLQREHLTEYKRIRETVIQFNRAASERATAQCKASLKSAQAW